MESLLLIVTMASLLLGAAMSVVGWRLLRRQREHSAARVEALQAMSAEPEEPVIAPVRAVTRLSVLDDAPLERPAAAVVGSAADANIEPEIESWDAMRDRPARPARRRPAEIHVRFTGPAESAAPGRRWVALAAVAVVMSLGIGAVYALYTTDVVGAIRRATTASASASPAASEPLQLLSLKHTTDESGTFVLTGLVQNPAAGRPLRNVIAVVYLFDQQGRYFASGKVAIDLASFHPGEESPFVVRIPDAAGVARYRVGFRMEDGGVVAHVDRRGQPPGGTVEDAIESDAPQPRTSRRSEG